MARKPIALERVRQAEAALAALLVEHPELRDPARQAALAAWLQHNLQEDTNDATDSEAGK